MNNKKDFVEIRLITAIAFVGSLILTLLTWL